MIDWNEYSINWEESAKLNRMSVEKLKTWLEKYSKSDKKVIRICKNCKEEKSVYLRAYHNLCHKCATTSSEFRELKAKQTTDYYKEHPESGEAHSKKLTQYYIDNPEAREAARLKTIEQMSDPKVRDAISKRSIKVWEDPEYKKSRSEAAIERCDDSKVRKAMSDRGIQYYVENPEARDRMSEIAKNSDVVKDAHKKQIGGEDLVWHHVAYDFLRPEALRVRITRKFHSSIHHPKGIQFSVHGYSLID